MRLLYMQILCLLTLLCYGSIAYNKALQGRSYLALRSQSMNGARSNAGLPMLTYHPRLRTVTQYDTNNQDMSCWYGLLTLTPAYTHSYKEARLTEYFFGDQELSLAGSLISERREEQLLADHFGLSPEYQSSVLTKPRITNQLIDIDGMISTHSYYATIRAPFVHNKRTWCINENFLDDLGSSVTTRFPQLYMDNNRVKPAVTTFADALNRDDTFGDVTEPLLFGRLSCYDEEKHFSDLHVGLGWHIYNTELKRISLGLLVAAPTGNTPSARFLLPAVVGNGHHWELGVQFSGQVTLWEKSDDQLFGAYWDLKVSHFFDSCQCRSFNIKRTVNNDCDCSIPDISAGYLSRYMLLKEFDSNSVYTGTCVPAINKTTLETNVSVGAQLDLMIMFAYMGGDFEYNIGYNAWIRSHEELCITQKFPDNTYALKGIQNVAIAGDLVDQSTESTATIFGHQLSEQTSFTDPRSPRFLTVDDLDLCSAASPRALSHKLFMHVGHAWNRCFDYAVPYVSAGLEIEFEGIKQHYTDPTDTALSLWGFWFKMGIHH